MTTVPSGRRLAAAATALITALPLAVACGGDGGGVPVINLYYAPEQNLRQVVDECTAAADGRYRIDYHVLPRGAGAQLVTRLSAESPATEGGQVEIWLNSEKIHLFDPATGRNLPVPPP